MKDKKKCSVSNAVYVRSDKSNKSLLFQQKSCQILTEFKIQRTQNSTKSKLQDKRTNWHMFVFRFEIVTKLFYLRLQTNYFCVSRFENLSPWSSRGIKVLELVTIFNNKMLQSVSTVSLTCIFWGWISWLSCVI